MQEKGRNFDKTIGSAIYLIYTLPHMPIFITLLNGHLQQKVSWTVDTLHKVPVVDVHWKLIPVRLLPCLTLEDTDKLANHKWKGRKK
jgi:hypothetical protein